MKKLVMLVLLLATTGTAMAQTASQDADTQKEPTWRDYIYRGKLQPSEAKAKKMTSIEGFAESSTPGYFNDVVYAHRSDMDLHLQIIKPDIDHKDKRPCIVYIQGSAWFRQDCYWRIPTLSEFSRRGYVIASVEHRPSTVAPYPAQLQDVKSAIRFMRRNADVWNVDTTNLFIWGDSSGGNLSLLAALTQDHAELDTIDDAGDASIAVNACVAFYPVTDLLRLQQDAPEGTDHISENSPSGYLFGHVPVLENASRVETASPVHFLSRERASQTAPILIMTGNRDCIVPFEQSVIMADSLESCGYDYRFYRLVGANHGSREFWTQTTLDVVHQFMQEHRR